MQGQVGSLKGNDRGRRSQSSGRCERETAALAAQRLVEGSNFKADGQPREVRRVQMQERKRGQPVSCAGESPQLFFCRVF